MLERLGVRDLVLPGPLPAQSIPTPAEEARPEADAGIGALVRRIEAFQRARRDTPAAPRLPLGDVREPQRAAPRRGFDFATDATGTIAWADPAMAPMVVGATLGARHPGAAAVVDPVAVRAMARRQPLRGARATLAGPPDIAGEWRIDAAPAFVPATGQFAGYEGRMRRPAAAPARRTASASGTGDRVRQLLHELRTPVGAIQGFAELIQQQMFGPAPHEYRALAAAIAVDAARLLAGFEELDRLAGLETGTMRLDEGESDLRETIALTVRRLDGVLRPRSARIELAATGGPFAIGLGETDSRQLVWRILATLAGALAPGETVALALHADRAQVTLTADLPAALLAEDPFAATALAQPRAIAAGAFGSGFTLRLARAEAVAAGGSLEAGEDDVLRLTLPALTAPAAGHTVEPQGSGGAAALSRKGFARGDAIDDRSAAAFGRCPVRPRVRAAFPAHR